METKSKRLQMKDVITLAIFNVAILVVMVAVKMIVMMVATPAFNYLAYVGVMALFCAPLYVVMSNKVAKPGTLFVTALFSGLMMLAFGSGWFLIVEIVVGVICELVMIGTDTYKNPMPNFYTGELSGTVTVNGKYPGVFLPDEKVQTLGVVFQDPRSQFFMGKVLDEIAFSAENIGMDSVQIIEKVMLCAKQLEIEELLEKNVNELSSGQKQRVAIAAATVFAPPVLILDEPVSNLDNNGIKILLKILTEIKEKGTTIIISEHRLHQFLPIADLYLHIDGGNLQHIWEKSDFKNLQYDDLMNWGIRHPDLVKKKQKLATSIDEFSKTVEIDHITFKYRKANYGLSSYISYVSQDNYLFNESILENIRMGRPSASDEEVISAAKQCGCHEFIMGLNNGYDTVVGGAGGHLSGGERQRIAIARAMLKNAPIVIFDEATAYLDPENENLVQQSISNLIKDKTLIVVAHRLYTITDADQIVVVNHGKVEAIGTHSELLNENRLYQNMWKAHTSSRDEGGDRA